MPVLSTDIAVSCRAAHRGTHSGPPRASARQRVIDTAAALCQQLHSLRMQHSKLHQRRCTTRSQFRIEFPSRKAHREPRSKVQRRTDAITPHTITMKPITIAIASRYSLQHISPHFAEAQVQHHAGLPQGVNNKPHGGDRLCTVKRHRDQVILWTLSPPCTFIRCFSHTDAPHILPRCPARRRWSAEPRPSCVCTSCSSADADSRAARCTPRTFESASTVVIGAARSNSTEIR